MLHVSTSTTSATLFTVTTPINGHSAKLHMNNGAPDDFCNATRVNDTGQTTSTAKKYHTRLANGRTMETNQLLRDATLELGPARSKLNIVTADLAKLEFILGHPLLTETNLDLERKANTISDRSLVSSYC
jgi:hypothetical protein